MDGTGTTTEILDDWVRRLPAQPDVIGEIFQILAPSVLALVRSRSSSRTDAESICQDTWVSVMTSLDRYEVKEPAWFTFRSYVFQIAKRKLIDHSRRKSASDLPETYDPAAPEQRDGLEHDEELQVMRGCIESLPDEFRQAVRGRMRGESPNEIAEKLQIPVGTYQSRRNRGEKMVRECMETKLNS
ncbi:RNA polymerase sigma factor [Stieleria varia]|uniref:ECF RNA polymerase sigma factor SigE n=1 Tax=Stieleria varia TaxID=2528005 RepID=A0A5C5ZZM8_9BACT|nr:RNA polymerase sigma factor [Stieleria varia]TWT92408.1 ECF RNA polymerase sigma factor SigE [Stieleria varia]